MGSLGPMVWTVMLRMKTNIFQKTLQVEAAISAKFEILYQTR